MKKALVLGAGGFIGSHMVTRLVKDGYEVLGVDLKYPDFSPTKAHAFVIGDLRDPIFVNDIMSTKSGGPFDLIFQFAADMGGCQYIFTGENDANVMHNSATINLNVLNSLSSQGFKGKIFYSSSACMYPQEKQKTLGDIKLAERDAYPANPDSDYGWEKLFSERLYLAYARNYGIDIRIARYHNIYGPEGTYFGGKEKAPASICRKVAEASEVVSVWGSGNQRRSFLYIDDCIDATLKLVSSGYKFPLNIGSDESVSILDLWNTAIEVSQKNLKIEHVNMPENVHGVMSRNSDNTMIEMATGWGKRYTLKQGIVETYRWISEMVKKTNDA